MIEHLLNKIHHADCMDIMKGISDNSIDCAIFDPPYKLSQKYTTSTDSDNLLAIASIYHCAIELNRIIKQGNLAAVIYDNRILPLILDAFKKANWKYIRALTLYRRAGSAHMMCGWMSTSDIIFIFQNGDGQLNFYGGCDHDVYIKDKLEKENHNHPAQKPEWLIERLVQRLTKENDVIIDPYSGSGTLPVVCNKLNRNFIAIEKDKDYHQDSVTRLEMEMSQGRLF